MRWQKCSVETTFCSAAAKCLIDQRPSIRNFTFHPLAILFTLCAMPVGNCGHFRPLNPIPISNESVILKVRLRVCVRASMCERMCGQVFERSQGALRFVFTEVFLSYIVWALFILEMTSPSDWRLLQNGRHDSGSSKTPCCRPCQFNFSIHLLGRTLSRTADLQCMLFLNGPTSWQTWNKREGLIKAQPITNSPKR